MLLGNQDTINGRWNAGKRIGAFGVFGVRNKKSNTSRSRRGEKTDLTIAVLDIDRRVARLSDNSTGNYNGQWNPRTNRGNPDLTLFKNEGRSRLRLRYKF